MIKVFVGCAANGEDIESQIVLEHSMRRHCSYDIDIIWMKLSRNQESPFGNWRSDLWATPFSGFRWAVPELCGFEGRAIYVDSDIIVKDDIAKLWNVPIDLGKIVVAKGGSDGWRFCVSLWDCAAAKQYIPSIKDMKLDTTAHQKMVNLLSSSKGMGLVQPFSNGNWNCIDGEDYRNINDPDIKILHYSSEAHQPQLRHCVDRLAASGMKHWFDGNIKQHWRPEIEMLFDRELDEAYKQGYSIESYEPEILYGAYVKRSQKNYRSHAWAK